MKITEKDIGRKVKDRFGSILTIEDVMTGNYSYPVFLSSKERVTTSGHYWQCETLSPLDIIEFVDEPIPQSETGSNVKLNDEDWPSPCSEDEELLGSTKSFADQIEDYFNSCVGEEDDEELDERFVTKVPSIESNTIRLLKQLKRQGITELTIVADLGDGKRGEIRMEIYNYGKN
jgi:hypothetical protein